jgi:hypothetical protein
LGLAPDSRGDPPDFPMTTAAPSLSPGTSRTSLAPLVPLLVAAVVYVAVMAVGGSLLNDADTYWHIAAGNWIEQNGLPTVDPFSFTFRGQPWIAKEWLSQIVLATASNSAGWPGVVVLSSSAIALACGLLAWFLQRTLYPIAAIVGVAVAFMLVTPHALARPHVLALPVMVAWVGTLVRAADNGKDPPYPLLLVMVLWANLHGGFTLGILLVGAVGLDAIASATREARLRTAFVWVRFGLLTLVAGCATPYGPQSLLVTWRILSLGPALDIISEWKAVDFGHLESVQVILLAGIGLALWQGVRLPWVRVLVIAGLVHLGISSVRNGEILGLLAPLFLATPLARQFPALRATPAAMRRLGAVAAVVILAALVPVTLALAAYGNFQPSPRITPRAAVLALKSASRGPVLNDYNLGGYLVYAGVPTFIDGRTELFGARFTVRHYRAMSLQNVGDFLKLLDEYKIDATLLAPETPANAFLDTLPDWKRVYGVGVAVLLLRTDAAR